jgi:hypothetical protein
MVCVDEGEGISRAALVLLQVCWSAAAGLALISQTTACAQMRCALLVVCMLTCSAVFMLLQLAEGWRGLAHPYCTDRARALPIVLPASGLALARDKSLRSGSSAAGSGSVSEVPTTAALVLVPLCRSPG